MQLLWALQATPLQYPPEARRVFQQNPWFTKCLPLAPPYENEFNSNTSCAPKRDQHKLRKGLAKIGGATLALSLILEACG
jgi:hypothetical protein